MVVEPGRCPTCAGMHGDALCQQAAPAELDLLAGGTCSCLPRAVDDWPACAFCGLPQAPGKAFCSFCGRRWVTEGSGAAAAPQSR